MNSQGDCIYIKTITNLSAMIIFSGVNNVNVTVGGTGFMSEIVRLFMKGLNTKHTLNEVSTNAGK